MTDTQLKPCPFCGEAAELNQYGRRYWAVCTGCRTYRSGTDEHEVDAIEAWNTRANTLTDAERAVVEAAVAEAENTRRNNGWTPLLTAVEALEEEDAEPVQLFEGDFSIERETDKAWLVKFEFYGEERTEWFPKSQCNLTSLEEGWLDCDILQVPRWLWNKKGLQ